MLNRARAGASASSSPAAEVRGERASHGSSSDASTTSSSGQTVALGQPRVGVGSMPDAAATASPTSRRGDGNSTFAQTPSRAARASRRGAPTAAG